MDFNDFHFLMSLSSRDLGKSTSLSRYVFPAAEFGPPLFLRPYSKFWDLRRFINRVLLLDISDFELVYETAAKVSIILEYAVSLRPRSIFVLFR